jgi:hypothetical protein
MIFNRIFPIGAVGADVRERDILWYRPVRPQWRISRFWQLIRPGISRRNRTLRAWRLNSIGVETLTASLVVRLYNIINALNKTGLTLGEGNDYLFRNNVISVNGVDRSPTGSEVLR